MVASHFEGRVDKVGEDEIIKGIDRQDFYQGVPAITVICDGGWSSAHTNTPIMRLVELGLIFGAETGKLLHIGVRNKLLYVLFVHTHRE